MSSDVKKNFASFGQKCLILAIISLVSFVLGLIAWSVPEVGYGNMAVMVAYVVVLILAVGDIKSADKTLNNDRLQQFRSKIIVAVILSLVGFILFTLGMVLLFASIQQAVESGEGGSAAAISAYVTFGIMILLGLVLLIVAFVLELLAWGRLKTFFKENQSMFFMYRPRRVINFTAFNIIPIF